MQNNTQQTTAVSIERLKTLGVNVVSPNRSQVDYETFREFDRMMREKPRWR